MRASPHLRERAKELRRAPTLSERRLWNWLRNRTFKGFKFRRQVPIDRYVVDFYCPALRLAIEVDGLHHETPWMSEYDSDRSEYLSSCGIEVIRFSNRLLARDSLMVEEIIECAIERRVEEGRPSSGLRPPSPRRRGEGP